MKPEDNPAEPFQNARSEATNMMADNPEFTEIGPRTAGLADVFDRPAS